MDSLLDILSFSAALRTLADCALTSPLLAVGVTGNILLTLPDPGSSVRLFLIIWTRDWTANLTSLPALFNSSVWTSESTEYNSDLAWKSVRESLAALQFGLYGDDLVSDSCPSSLLVDRLTISAHRTTFLEFPASGSVMFKMFQ